MDVLDNEPLLERHFVYNWVQDARSFVLDGKLTPAGREYANHHSALAFNRKSEYIHNWHIAPPFAYLNVNSDYKSLDMKFYDHNGETGRNYIIECKKDNKTEWTVYKTLTLGTEMPFW